MTPALGFVVRPEHPPEALPRLAAAVEDAGFDELWLWEDCFFAGGIAAMGAALAATSRIPVGIGILPAPARNAAFAAMEIAALARLYPGRVIAGFGHGVPRWMRQIGGVPKSSLALLEETIVAVRALLAGEEVRMDGRYVRLDPARLDHPPAEPPPVLAGVRRERSLALSGRVADGTVLSELAGVEYVRWALERIAAERPHRLVVYAAAGAGEEGRAALRADVAERLLDGGPHVEQAGIEEEVAALGPERLAAGMPEAWLDRLTVSGTPEQARATVTALGEAGADAIVLVPPRSGADPHELARLLG